MLQNLLTMLTRMILTTMAVLLVVILYFTSQPFWHTYGLAIPFVAYGVTPSTISTEVTQQSTMEHQYWQAGTIVDATGRYATAMQTTLRVQIPAQIAEKTTEYFWIGSYLANHAFIQIGYAIPWYDRSPRWFYCAFTPDGQKGPCAMGDQGSGGIQGSIHHYALSVVADSFPGMWKWMASVDNQVIGTIQESAGSTGLSTPGIFAEQSAYVPMRAVDILGPTAFSPAIEISTASHDAMYSVGLDHLVAEYSAPDVCLEYGIAVQGNSTVLLGSHLPCVSEYSVLKHG